MINISTNHLYSKIMQLCGTSQSNIQLVAPYLKKNIFQQINKIKPQNTNLDLITNITVRNVASGATDLAAINYCLQMHGTAYNRAHLHAKMYLFDHRFGIITSANLTNSGLHNNYEASVLFDDPTLISQLDQAIKNLKTDNLTGLITTDNLTQTQALAQKIKAKYNNVEPKQKTLGNVLYQQLTGWNALVFKIINEQFNTDKFTLEEVYKYKSFFEQSYPSNQNIEAKIRQTLQNLRNIGLIEFIGNGIYKKGY